MKKLGLISASSALLLVAAVPPAYAAAALAIAFDCVRTANGAKAEANFFGVLDDKRSELRFHALPSAPPFDIVNVAGSARKQ